VKKISNPRILRISRTVALRVREGPPRSERTIKQRPAPGTMRAPLAAAVAVSTPRHALDEPGPAPDSRPPSPAAGAPARTGGRAPRAGSVQSRERVKACAGVRGRAGERTGARRGRRPHVHARAPRRPCVFLAARAPLHPRRAVGAACAGAGWAARHTQGARRSARRPAGCVSGALWGAGGPCPRLAVRRRA